MSDKLYTIKPLEWENVKSSDAHYAYPLGKTFWYVVGKQPNVIKRDDDKKDVKTWWIISGDSVGRRCDSITDGKTQAQKHYEEVMAAGLVEHVCEWVDGKPGCNGIDDWCQFCGGKIKEVNDDND